MIIGMNDVLILLLFRIPLQKPAKYGICIVNRARFCVDVKWILIIQMFLNTFKDVCCGGKLDSNSAWTPVGSDSDKL